MLKKRIILSLCLSNGQLTRTKWFRPDRWYTLNFVDLELADEIVLLDVTRGQSATGQLTRTNMAGLAEWGERREKFWATVRDFSRNLFLPLSVGGFIRNMDDVRRAFAEGADKVVVNTELCRRPDFGREIAEKYGSQALVGSMDCKNGLVYISQAGENTGIDVRAYCELLVTQGVGEILLMDIARDGSLQGYNLDLIRTAAVGVPVITVGGMGCWRHAEEGFAAGADACATQVIFHYTTTSLTACKSYLQDHGVPMRL